MRCLALIIFCASAGLVFSAESVPTTAPSATTSPANAQAPATRPVEVIVRVANSIKYIDVAEAERTIHIEQRPTGITMTVSAMIDGHPESVQFQARNATELKDNQPEAFVIYARYADMLPNAPPPPLARIPNQGFAGAIKQMQLELQALGLDDNDAIMLLDPNELARMQRLVQTGQLRAPRALHDVDVMQPAPPSNNESIDRLIQQLRQIQPTLTPIPKAQ